MNELLVAALGFIAFPVVYLSVMLGWIGYRHAMVHRNRCPRCFAEGTVDIDRGGLAECDQCQFSATV